MLASALFLIEPDKSHTYEKAIQQLDMLDRFRMSGPEVREKIYAEIGRSPDIFAQDFVDHSTSPIRFQYTGDDITVFPRLPNGLRFDTVEVRSIQKLIYGRICYPGPLSDDTKRNIESSYRRIGGDDWIHLRIDAKVDDCDTRNWDESYFKYCSATIYSDKISITGEYSVVCRETDLFRKLDGIPSFSDIDKVHSLVGHRTPSQAIEALRAEEDRRRQTISVFGVGFKGQYVGLFLPIAGALMALYVLSHAIEFRSAEGGQLSEPDVLSMDNWAAGFVRGLLFLSLIGGETLHIVRTIADYRDREMLNNFMLAGLFLVGFVQFYATARIFGIARRARRAAKPQSALNIG